jgi:hypothetical protein
MGTRRDFLKAGAVGGSGLYLASKFGFIQRAFTQSVPGGSLDPFGIQRFITPLFIPPAMPPTSTAGAIDYYEIATRQLKQQILPPACRARLSGRMDQSIMQARSIHRRPRSKRTRTRHPGDQ